VYILSYTASAIKTVVSQTNIRRLELILQHPEWLHVKVKLIQIPSHVGIHGNETADRLAYKTSQKLFKGKMTASKAGFKMAHHIAEKSWELQ